MDSQIKIHQIGSSAKNFFFVLVCYLHTCYVYVYVHGCACAIVYT